MNKIKAALFHQSGRSMIEMLGVLAIIGVLSVGGLAGYNMAMRKIRIQRFVEEIQKFVQEAYLLYEDSGFPRESFKPLTGVSDKGIREAMAVVDPNIELMSFHFGAGSYDFYLSFRKLPIDACTALFSLEIKDVCLNDGSRLSIPLKSRDKAVSYCQSTTQSGEQNLIFGHTTCRQKWAETP